jgi:hypothetical protein
MKKKQTMIVKSKQNKQGWQADEKEKEKCFLLHT